MPDQLDERPDEAPHDDAQAEGIAAEVYAEQFETIKRYVDILTSRGIDWGLLGPREPERIWARHILNCAALDSLLSPGLDVMDIGSGAGLPGLPIAILRPDLNVTLVESLLRRANFLELAVSELGLGDRVRVVRGRAEEQKLSPDVVTCRAVAPLDKLVKWTSRQFLPDGQLIALKGERAPVEVDEFRGELRRRGLEASVMSVRAHQLAEATQAVVVRRA